MSHILGIHISSHEGIFRQGKLYFHYVHQFFSTILETREEWKDFTHCKGRYTSAPSFFQLHWASNTARFWSQQITISRAVIVAISAFCYTNCMGLILSSIRTTNSCHREPFSPARVFHPKFLSCTAVTGIFLHHSTINSGITLQAIKRLPPGYFPHFPHFPLQDETFTRS